MELIETTTTSPYRWVTQPKVLEALKSEGITVSAQALRNWTKASLIIPPRHRGRLGGRIAEYCEFAIAEAFAVYRLTQAAYSVRINGADMTLPKFSLAQLSMARQVLQRAGYQVQGYPLPPKDGAIKAGRLNFNIKVPTDELPPRPCIMMHESEAGARWDSFKDEKELLRYSLCQTVYAAWAYSLSLGCERFLAHYKQLSVDLPTHK